MKSHYLKQYLKVQPQLFKRKMPSRYSDYRVDLNAELIWLPNWPTFHQISVATIKKIDSGDDINNTRFPICIGFNHFANQ